ncbi:hypothetical protein ACFLSQ_07355, partial [Bacteroidota bacterium]
MSNNEILKWCKEQAEQNDYITFPDSIFNILTDENAKSIVQKFGKNTLMKLPNREIEFFEWLKDNDRKIWDDLWETDKDKYVVAVNFLSMLLDKKRGFPVCDLVANDNYFFTSSHMVDEESKIMIESVQNMYMDKKQLTVEQTLVLEISLAPIDIWRFAYRYNIALD